MKSKRDRNHTEIVRAFEACHCSVHDTHKVGGGFPDLVCATADVEFLVEVKWPGEEESLTPAQVRFRRTWRGTVHTVTTPEQATTLATRIRREALGRENGRTLLTRLWEYVGRGLPVSILLRRDTERFLDETG